MTTLTLDFVVVVGEEEAGAACVSGLFSEEEEAEAEGVATTESSVSMLYKGLPTVIYTHTHTHVQESTPYT
jgi:hypothetical protein